jgi:hypothetical protein
VRFEDCYHSIDDADSPTGVTFSVNNLFFENIGAYLPIIRGRFWYKPRSGPSAAMGGYDASPQYYDCEFRSATGSAFAAYGRAFGENHYIRDDGGAPFGHPGGGVSSNDTGRSYGSFYVNADRLPPTHDEADNRIRTDVKGDVAAMLTPGTDGNVQRWTTPLTADRAVTLAAGKRGNRFKVVRPAAGAFNLNVGAGPLRTLAAAQWAEVEHDGTAWQLVAAGEL